MESNWITYKDRTIYDGWCLRYNTATGEIQWRDAWFVDRLSEERKKEIENEVRQLMNNETGA